MNTIKHSYVGGFDENGRITIAPSDVPATTELETEPFEPMNIIFSHQLSDDQKSTLRKLGNLLLGRVG